MHAAHTLRNRGFNPIPSHPEAGHPIFPYSKARDQGLSEQSFRRLCLSGSVNIQVATGTIWGLAPVDVDGPDGKAMLQTLTMFRPLPPTPTVITPRDGVQYWFRVPAGVERIPNVDLWKGDGHNGIEILGDGKLAKCPPSFKVIDGRRVPYRWMPGRSLDDLAMAELPAWVLRMGLEIESHARTRLAFAPPPPLPDRPRGPMPAVDGSYDLLDVQASLSERDRIDLAGRWGLRIVHDRPNASGWIPCHSIRREDRHPSGRFNVTNGCYCDKATGETIRFFALSVHLGTYPDIATAINQIGSTFHAKRAS